MKLYAIKKLEWKPVSAIWSQATIPKGWRYLAGEKEVYLHFLANCLWSSACDSHEHGKALAEADWLSRITAGLVEVMDDMGVPTNQ